MQTAAAIVPPDHALPDDAYAILRSRLQAIGCFQRQPGYYLRKTAISAAALGGVVALAVLADSTLVVLLSAIALGIMSTQFGLIAHDVAHKQVFRGRRAIAGASLILGNLLLGMSYTWWREKHDRHHATPNHVTRDPDCDISLLVLAPGQRSQRPPHRPGRRALAVPLLLVPDPLPGHRHAHPQHQPHHQDPQLAGLL